MNLTEKTDFLGMVAKLHSQLGLSARLTHELKNCAVGFMRKKRQLDERDKRIDKLEMYIESIQKMPDFLSIESAERKEKLEEYHASLGDPS